jgi:hypothetical protein
MERHPHSVYSRPASGGLIHLQIRLTDLRIWLGPAWATLCGVIASGGFEWQSQSWLRLALLILLVDGTWGTIWAALGSANWVKALRRWRNWRFGEPVPPPPYTLPGTAGDRASRWLGQLRTWWRDILWPTCGPALSAVIVALPVMIILGLILGSKLLALSIAALAAIQLNLAWENSWGKVAPGWNPLITALLTWFTGSVSVLLSGLVAIALPWVAGHVAFGTPTPGSIILASAFALSWAAAWRTDASWGLTLAVGGGLLAFVLLIALHRPLAAGGLALLLAPQFALLPWLRHGQPPPWYVRYSRPWLMAAMLISAWAL